MRCYHHNDREAVGQCEKCKTCFCTDCWSQSSNGICHNCTQKTNQEAADRFQKEIWEKNFNKPHQDRKTAKTDRKIFMIFAPLGIIFFTILFASIGIDFNDGQPLWWRLGNVLGVLLFSLPAGYALGAGILGIKKAVCLALKSSALLVIIFIIFLLPACAAFGFFATPYWLYKARQTLRDTKGLENVPSQNPQTGFF